MATKTRRPTAKRTAAPKKDSPPPPRLRNSKTTPPVVGIGASAGGIEAVSDLLRNLPADPGMAFVLVQHQDPNRVSGLAQVLSRTTSLPVRQAENRERLEPNVLYVAPPDGDLHLAGGVLRVLPRNARGTMPIDSFFRSLAADQGGRAIGVVLSGAASDGALGAKAIKAAGGITFAQDASAKFDSMPHAAMMAGAIDFVLPPAEIAKELGRIARHAYVVRTDAAADRLPQQELATIFAILHEAHEVDFTHYKPGTVERRIRRRMALNKVDSLGDYIQALHNNPTEIEQLYGDILIRVTGFFRDPEVFEALKHDILPRLAHERARAGAGAPIRIWVPGCATGEEVYSLAIAFLEAVPEGLPCPMQMFGTDISDSAIDRARSGFYPENISAEVSPERMRRFFTHDDGGYRVNKKVRDCCVFARQDLTKDPPFSKLDLISCRNVMIYLGNVLQRRVMSIFHYALRDDGYLVLGSAEAISNFDSLFGVVDRKQKIYQKKAAVNHRHGFDLAPLPARERPPMPRFDEGAVAATNVAREADRALLARYSPVGVVVNDRMEIVQFRGRTSLYLEPAPGAASFNVLKMSREGLLSELRNAIQTARRKDVPVRRSGVRIKTDEHMTVVDVEVIPFFGSAQERYFAILFEPAPIPAPEETKPGRKKRPTKAEDPRQIARLKRELDATREYLQSIIEDQETMNEELRSANEEIQSSNEEMQSTNEELETAKEELQSSNEELTTLNEELETRHDELMQLNNDLLNLLTSVDIAIVMLDAGLRIRRFNSGAQRVLNLIAADAGRSIAELKTPLELDKLQEMVTGVMDDLEMREEVVKDRSGRSYILRVRPYKTMDNKIDGAVLVLVDVEQWKRE